MSYPKHTIQTLIASLVTLAWMVPGGPVETRDFSHLEPWVAWGFNIFLTTLVVGSLMLVYFMLKKQKWAFQMTGVVGLAFFLVFTLDLGEIFPVSPDPMSSMLLALEIAGVIFGLLLMWLAFQSVRVSDPSYWQSQLQIPGGIILLSVALLLFGAYVVYFATASTLHF